MPDIKVTIRADLEEAADAVADFARKAKASLNDAFTTAVDKATAKLEELDRKYKQVQDTIDRDKQKLEELTRKREDCAKEVQKQLDQEIAGLNRVINGREQQKLKLEEQRVKLEEVGKIAVAASEAEKNAIRDATNERIAAIGTLKDQVRAQAGVNAAVEEGTSMLGSYFSRFLGVGTAISAVSALTSAYKAQQQAIADTAAALDNLNNKALGKHAKFKDVFNEFGLRDAGEQDAAQATLTGLGGKLKVSDETMAGVSSRLASAAKSAGMTGVNDPRFLSIVGNVGMAVEQGMAQNAATDFAVDKLGENPNVTGEEINQQLANVRAAAGGSPRRASEWLQALQEQRGILKNTGMTDNDFLKYNAALMKNGVPEDEAKTLSRGHFQALNRLKGLDKKELVAEYEKMQGDSLAPQTVMQLRAMEKFSTPAMLLAMMKANSPTGIHALDKQFDDAMTSGHLDIPAFDSISSGLSGDNLDRVAKVYGGPRNIVSAGQGAGAGQMTLPTGSMFSTLKSPLDLAKIFAQQAENQVIKDNPYVSGQVEFDALSKGQLESLKANPTDRQSGSGRQAQMLGGTEKGGNPFLTQSRTDEFQAAVLAHKQKAMEIATILHEMDTGARPDDATKRVVLLGALSKLLEPLGPEMGGLGGLFQEKDSGMFGQFPGRSTLVGQYGAAQSKPSWLRNQTTTPVDNMINMDIENAPRAADRFDTAQKAIDFSKFDMHPSTVMPSTQGVHPHRGLKPGLTVPTTQPAAHSVNYNIRQYNYGYTPGNIAAPEQYPTRMG